MSMTDPISDMICRIKNGQMAMLKCVAIPYSRIKEEILKVLVEEGYVVGYQVKNRDSNSEAVKIINLELKYKSGKGVIKEFKRVSKPGLRVYRSVSDFAAHRYYNGLGLNLLSTSLGVMTDSKAKSQNVGGEVLCKIY